MIQSIGFFQLLAWLQLLNSAVKKERDSTAKTSISKSPDINSRCDSSNTLRAYSGPMAKQKQQMITDEQNDAESDAANGDVPDISAEDHDEIYEYAYDDKIDERSVELINFEEDALASPATNHQKLIVNEQLRTANKELLEMQKCLLEREYNDLYAFRLERHQLEMSILKAELAHKTIEHQKRMDILNKKLEHS